ncbi:hypothetical protein ACGF13_14250 [Kitasatospora sp. NPDC048286]|uniref:hypothetical protein n=1 Tax=Kitasatospora sp. NPDC048286 TaxID=3364047 RepID=UPI00371C6A3F
MPQEELNEAARTAFLATKATFMDALTQLCELTGADIKDLARALELDDRIGTMNVDRSAYESETLRRFLAQLEDEEITAPLRFLRLMDS